MASPSLTGSRIRSYRIDKGLRQADLARACDISPSYLNLIEHNRRRIGGGLLVRIAKALEVDPSYLSGGVEVRIATEMDAAAEDHAAAAPERGRSEELASRFPGWARLIAEQRRENRRLRDVIERLGDRLTHDPFLSASMHNVLTSVTAIRSASAILAQDRDIEPEWQMRFHRNIFEDSQRLAAATEDLVSYLDSDSAGGAGGGSLPQEDFDAWLVSTNWRIATLEEDPDAALDPILESADSLKAEAARSMARSYLTRYAADAKALPLDRLRDELAREAGVTQLAAVFGVDLPLVFRRLAVLSPEEVPGGSAYGLVACDASGTLTYRKPLVDFDLPRYSAACPFWPLFTALQRPMTPVTAALAMAGRHEARFRVQAFAETTYPSGYDGPAVTEAWMLIHPSVENEEKLTKVGTSCRICPEADCVARREPSVFG